MKTYSYTDTSNDLFPAASLSAIGDGIGMWTTLTGNNAEKFFDEIKEATRQAQAHRGYAVNVNEYVTRVIAKYFLPKAKGGAA